jgi:hypothetical protein
LSYEEETEDTDIFYPNSTWTQGKNKLREYALSLEKKYDYYIYLDEDIVFEGVDTEAGFDAVENLLLKYKPIIAVPHLFGNGWHEQGNLKTEAQTTYWIDGNFDCWSADTFKNSKIFPMVGLFDYTGPGCWGASVVMQKLCRVYHENQVVLFNDVKIHNTQHKSGYRQENRWEDTDQYTLKVARGDPEVSEARINRFLEWSPTVHNWENKRSDHIEIKEGDRTYLNNRIGFRK